MRSRIRAFLIDRSGETYIEAVVLGVMFTLIMVSLATI